MGEQNNGRTVFKEIDSPTLFLLIYNIFYFTQAPITVFSTLLNPI